MRGSMALGAMAAALLPAGAQAQAQANVAAGLTDSGDTAWLLAATLIALVALPAGLALRYVAREGAGTATPVRIVLITAALSLFWVVAGYSLTFAPGGVAVGSLQNLLFGNMLAVREGQSVGELVFGLFQLGFALLAPLLLIGALLGRARTGWLLGFVLIWSLLVYVPVTRALWGGGWLAGFGVIDLAGGLAVHVAAGSSALVAALMIGRRIGFSGSSVPGDHGPTALGGGALLWAGLLALTGAAGLTASDVAGATALIDGQCAAAAGLLAWAAADRRVRAGGLVAGAVAGLAGVAAGAGTMGPLGAIATGVLCSLAARQTTGFVRVRLGVDDSMAVFALHGVAGAIGVLLLAPFSSEALGGVGYDPGADWLSQLLIQALGLAAVAIWSGVVTLIAGFGVALVLPMRDEGAIAMPELSPAQG